MREVLSEFFSKLFGFQFLLHIRSVREVQYFLDSAFFWILNEQLHVVSHEFVSLFLRQHCLLVGLGAGESQTDHEKPVYQTGALGDVSSGLVTFDIGVVLTQKLDHLYKAVVGGMD